MAETALPFGVVDNVHKAYRGTGGDALVALDHVSQVLHRGELIALLGPSGCGKTTLLRIVGGLSRPSSGRVLIRGQEVRGPQEDAAFMFQSPTLLPWRSVLDNVLFPAEIQHRRNRATEDRAHALLDLVGLGGFARSRPHQLSGGMKQRAALCRALVLAPSLLLMDEPFGALDELTRMEMHDLLLGIRQQTGTTILFVTHSVQEAVYLADEILVFTPRPGRIAERIRVELPYPRHADTRFLPAFTAYARQASAALGVLSHG